MSGIRISPADPNSFTVTVGGTGGVIGTSGINNNGAYTGMGKVPSHLIDPSMFDHYMKDHQIQGQTIMAEYILPPDYLGMKESEIKKLLIEKLVQEMYKVNNQHNIEFTQMKKVDTDEMVYRARIHVVPDTQVRIIRELINAKKTT